MRSAGPQHRAHRSPLWGDDGREGLPSGYWKHAERDRLDGMPACTGYGLTGDRKCEKCDGVGWLFARR